jgi:hypothetical protein
MWRLEGYARNRASWTVYMRRVGNEAASIVAQFGRGQDCVDGNRGFSTMFLK